MCDSTLACELFFFFEISLSPSLFIFVAAARARGQIIRATRVLDTDNRERNGVSLVSLLFFS